MAGTRIFFAVVGAQGDLASVTVDEPYEKVRAGMSGSVWPEFTRDGQKIAINPAHVAYVEPEPASSPVARSEGFRVRGRNE